MDTVSGTAVDKLRPLVTGRLGMCGDSSTGLSRPARRSAVPVRDSRRRTWGCWVVAWFEGFTRLYSKKIENHAAAVALYFMHYNFVRIHTTTRITPAMAAGVTDRAWEVADIVALLDAEPVASLA